MDRREEDLAAQAWPGFVDILSSTVIMFVFFVMVMVVVLYLYALKYTSTVKEQAQQQIQKTIEDIENKTVMDLESEKAQKVIEIKELSQQKEEIEKEVKALEDRAAQLTADMAESVNQTFHVEGRQFTIMFVDNSITLNDDISEGIKIFLDENSGGQEVHIEAGDDPMAVTQTAGRNINLARMLNVRNIALAEGYEPKQISVNYVDPVKIDGNYNWVRVVLK